METVRDKILKKYIKWQVYRIKIIMAYGFKHMNSGSEWGIVKEKKLRKLSKFVDQTHHSFTRL